MKVVVSSNCMTGGLAASLRILFPGHEVAAIPYSVLPASDLAEHISGADVCFYSGPSDLVPTHLPETDQRVVRFPELYFNAFHPDQVYAWMPDGSLVESATGPYNSAIALWAWRRGLSAAQTIELFSDKVMSALGYHARWSASVERLRHDFTPFPHLDYRDFLDPLRRSGCFMHTVNHPKVTAIASMARVLAAQINPTALTTPIPLESLLVDSLFNASFAWSVYPSVANSMGFTSDFGWKLEDHSVIGLEQFVVDSFAKYDIQRPREINCHELLWPVYDEVLLPASRKVA
jgi:hypothetical protein